MSQGFELSEQEQGEVEERKRPRAQVRYEAIRAEGEHGLERRATALARGATRSRPRRIDERSAAATLRALIEAWLAKA